MSLQVSSLYATAVLLLCLTPGPYGLLAVTNGVRFGVGRALVSTLGCAAGLTLLIGVSLSGFGVILAGLGNGLLHHQVVRGLLSHLPRRHPHSRARRVRRCYWREPPDQATKPNLPVRTGAVDHRHESEGGDLPCRLSAAVLRSPTRPKPNKST